jgi:hypothetical protein
MNIISGQAAIFGDQNAFVWYQGTTSVVPK